MKTKAKTPELLINDVVSDRKSKSIRYAFAFLIAVMFITGCEKFSGIPSDGPLTNTASIGLELIADNLVSPLSAVQAPDSSNRLFILDQVGKVWIIGADGQKLAEPFADVSSKLISLSPQYDERGLLSIAFHPEYKNNGKFYLFYTTSPRAGGPAPGVNWNHLNRISEFKVLSGNPNKADMASERVVMEIDHPQGNHNGGTIAFCADGYLYISVGDGGNADDVGAGHVPDWYEVNAGGNGQDILANLQGNILRIDVNCATGYLIPKSNPFVGKPGLDEIWAFGFRNPYRFSFDLGGKHQLYAGDAGQGLYEEIDIVSKGGNYGWNVKEGTHCFNTDNNSVVRPTCPDTDPDGRKLIDPIIEVNNVANPNGGIATTIVGGNVYRGKTIPQFQGKYIFGIFSSGFTTPNGKIFVSESASSGLWSYEEIVLKDFSNNLGLFLKGFGQDLKGEIYIVGSTQLGPSGNSGKVYKLAMVE
ncbi:PQQ-dependent sugar dehydrogenase [Daejeonella oryzae]|uniref:PQQ-dependent sugar dehydrogenase n=1 Tax=Daejeonella oryzae TaxID=1122943 RepID=UPI00042584CA|nr:PQQ-dependent sugar dehydrogenase [Daejeonella oryzae]